MASAKQLRSEPMWAWPHPEPTPARGDCVRIEDPFLGIAGYFIVSDVTPGERGHTTFTMIPDPFDVLNERNA